MQRNIITSARQADRLGYEAAMWNMGMDSFTDYIERTEAPNAIQSPLVCSGKEDSQNKGPPTRMAPAKLL